MCAWKEDNRATIAPIAMWTEKIVGIFGMKRSKRGTTILIFAKKIVITEAGLKTRGSIRPCEARSSISIVVSGLRRCSPLLPLSHFIGTGYVKNLLAPTVSSR